MPQRMKCSRKRALAPPDWLPSTARHLPSIPSLEAKAAGGEENARDWPESDTTSSTEIEVKNEIGWRRIWAQRQDRLIQRYLDGAEGTHVLDAQVVKAWLSEAVPQRMGRVVAQNQSDSDGTRAHSGNDLDSIIVKSLRKAILRGRAADAENEDPGRGGSLSAKIVSPGRPRSASKLASAERMERTLPGWSRTPELLGTWCDMAYALTWDGHQCTWLSLMLCVSTFLRSNQLMRLQGMYVVNPHASTLGKWSLLV